MTSNSAKYAYYAFPPTPTRESPRTRRTPPTSETATSNSRTSSHSSSAASGVMTPSPAARGQQAQSQAQQSKPPQTPTKLAKRPGQTPQKSGGVGSQKKDPAPAQKASTPSKLGQAAKKPQQQQPPSTPKAAGAQQPETDEPLTPKPSAKQGPGGKAGKPASLSRGPSKRDIGSANDALSQTTGRETQDDEPSGKNDAKKDVGGEEDDDEPMSKVTPAGDELEHAAPEPIQDDEDEDDQDHPGEKADDQDEDQDEDAQDQDQDQPQEDEAHDATEQDDQQGESPEAQQSQQPKQQQNNRSKGLLSGAQSLAGKASGLAGRANGSAKQAGSTAGKATQDPQAAADDAKTGAAQTADEAGKTAQEDVDGAKDAAEGTAQTAQDGVDGAKDAAEDTAQTAGDTAEDAAQQATDGVDAEKAQDSAKDLTNGVPQPPENLPLDLSVLKGLEVDEHGDVHDRDGNPLGRLSEGDAEDLAGYPIGDDGEILDDDGDLVGRVELLPDEVKRQLQSVRDEGGELPEGADEYLEQLGDAAEDAEDGVEEAAGGLPGLDILEGLSCQVDGLVYDADGNTVGKVVDGDPEQLQHATLNDQGEFVDDEGNVVGYADLHEEVQQLVEQGVYEPQNAANDAVEEGEDAAEDAADAADAAGDAVEDAAPEGMEDQLPGIEALQGRELNEAGEVLDDDGNLLGGIEDEELKQKIANGEIDPNTLTIDEHGQILDADGNVLSKTELADGAAERLAGLLDFRILNGKKINKKGKILDDDGEEIGELTDGELADCTGQKVNDKGEVFNKQGELVGHVRVVPGEAAETATRELLEELGELDQGEGEEAAEDAGETDEIDISILDGLKVNKKGQVLNEDGEPVGELASGELKDCAGKKINDAGEVLDKDGNVVGTVRTLPQQQEQEEQQAEAQDLSGLEGYKVNKKGQVMNEDGETIGELADGELSQCAGKKINDQGEILDDSGNVIGTVRLLQDSQEEPQEEGDQQELPPLSVLEGLTVNKAGNIIDSNGTVVGQLVEGDAKKLSKSGITCDAEGQFWDNKGHVIGRAETVPVEDAEEEAAFAGLEGLHVVEEGWVQDANGHTVGYVTEGDAKKLIGREVDEDGDIIDKKGTVVGHADRYEPDEEEEEQPAADLSFLQGKTVNKAGMVIGDDGVPVARLVEGQPKELAGRQLDDQGQLWNDTGKVVGRVELIPEDEREQKPEGPFAGLQDLRVIQGGKVADEDGNVVGEIVEGNARRLVGLTVDEDGDIVDKYGNVKGRAEPLPEEEATDYSILDGLTLNKQGNVVDSNGVPVGKLVEGNANELAGRQCDENGFIYNDTGKIAGRCEPIPEEERVAKPEGPFAGLQGLRVAKGGKVVDEDGNEVGEITEGDAKRLVGLTVDEDGDIIDKFGNTKGHAEPLVEEEEEAVDNSVLNNKSLNKSGYVVDENGIPFGRLFEGNVSELAGRKCDENGYIYGDTGKVVGRCEVLPENERVARPEGPFAGLEGLRVVKDSFVEDIDGNRVGQIVEGDPKRLVGLHVDEDGDIIDKYGNVKGHAEPWSEEEEQAEDLSGLAGTTINKAGYAVDGNGTIMGQVSEGNVKNMVGKKVDGEGQIWDDAGNVIGRCELVHGVGAPEGPFAGFDGLQIQKDGSITTPAGDIVGRVVEGDIKKLLGHTVDEDGDINDKNGNTIGKAERWEPEEKERRVNPMSGKRVNKEGEVRDENGDLIGRLTSGDLGHCVGQEIDDAGNVVDVDGNKIGEATLIENIAEDEYEGPSEEELAEAAKREEEREVAEKMGGICTQTLERMQPICKQITEHMEKADRTPKDELDEEELVNQVKPLIEEGGRILQECNGSLRGLDPDGHIAAQAKGRAGTGEATPEEYRLAETLKELTTTVVTTIDNAKKKLNDMPHAKKKLNPMWALLTQPLFQILAAVGLLLAGVLGLVGQLLNALGLGGLVNGLLGGLGINKLLASFGLIDDDKKKEKKGGSNPLGSIPVVGGLLGGKG